MASIKQLGEKKDNISSIISWIRKNGAATRMEITKALSLSWACVSDLVALLMEEEILMEAEQSVKGVSPSAKGRTPTYISLNERKYFLGVDINDSGIAITTLSMNGKRIRSKKWEEECFANENELSRSVCDKISQMLDNKEDCCGIGVAMEGARSPDGGYWYPILSGYISVHPDRLIEARFGLPVFVRHDPECILYSAASPQGADCIAIRVDNGIGVAAMKRGKILDFPLELGLTRHGSFRLVDILRFCKKKEDYGEIAEALGYAAGNLSVVLGIKKCIIAGEIFEWFDEVSDLFDMALKRVSPKLEYERCLVSDASDGAARLAMTEWSIVNNKKEKKEKHEHE